MAQKTAETVSLELPPLVVIGASAGGIDALHQVLGPLPTSFPASIVVAQHTQPSRVSHLAQVLGARTKLPVVTVEGREELQSGTVYLVPSNHHVVVTDHVVESREAGGDRPSPSIDRLLATAAEVYGERLIAVILSGMGSDGVAGASEVKARGGTVVIQNPATAAHPSMPRALPPTLVDFVANSDRMAELLVELASAPVATRPQDDERLLNQFLERVRERTGIDFSVYKRPTILRRLQRRLVATSSPNLRDYVRYVHKHPEEYGRLASAFLVKVTQFFRDADLFEHLRTELLPTLVEEARSRGRELRIWSAGCATGEEAYSLAILAAEAVSSEREAFSIRIFATDLDDEAIAFARRAVYPPSAMASVSPELLAKYFIKRDDDYEVAKEIRSLVVFGQHDLGQRAPFPRTDLTLCRNVLIYFTPELQKRALQLFAFSLREGGHLVLGKAETSTPYAEHFVLEQPRLKIYRRIGERVLIPPVRIRDMAPVNLPRLAARREPAWATTQQGFRSSRELGALGEGDQILLRLPVGVVVIDAQYDISFINAAARRLLGIHGSALGSDFIHLARQLPSEEIRAAVAVVIERRARVELRPMPFEREEGGATTHVKLTLEPFREDGAAPPSSVIVTVVDVSEQSRQRQDLEIELGRNRDGRADLEQRLERATRSNAELLAANDEVTTANAILRTANEELLVANEESQASTEEVETLNEELQATNEELETVNEELQASIEELNTTNDDLEARTTELSAAAATLAEQRQRSELERQRLAVVLDGMSEAVLVVDRSGRTISTNRAYDEAFGSQEFAPEDGAGIPLPEDEWPQRRAANGESFSMSFTYVVPDASDRRWYEAAGQGAADGDGGIVVIRDITDRSLRHLQERFIDAAGHELKSPVAALQHYIELIERGLAPSVDPATLGYLRGAAEQSRVLGELAARLFDVSLVRHGRLVLRSEVVDLGDVIQRAIEQTRAVFEDARIEAHLGRSKIPVSGDPLRLGQLFGNLLRNAVTHGRAPAPVSVTLERHGSSAAVRVADRGPGLPPAVQTQVFSPFMSGATGQGEGLGLGLYLARAIAGAHGGSMTVESRAGGGTEVTVTLPTTQSARTRPARTRPARPRREAGAARKEVSR